MPDSFSALQSKYGDRFELTQLAAYFRAIEDGNLSAREDSGVNLLSPTACLELTDEFCDFHPLFEADELLNLLILDDANTSNHHCYAFSLPYPGRSCTSRTMTPHELTFRTINDFVESARDAITNERF